MKSTKIEIVFLLLGTLFCKGNAITGAWSNQKAHTTDYIEALKGFHMDASIENQVHSYQSIPDLVVAVNHQISQKVHATHPYTIALAYYQKTLLCQKTTQRAFQEANTYNATLTKHYAEHLTKFLQFFSEWTFSFPKKKLAPSEYKLAAFPISAYLYGFKFLELFPKESDQYVKNQRLYLDMSLRNLLPNSFYEKVNNQMRGFIIKNQNNNIRTITVPNVNKEWFPTPSPQNKKKVTTPPITNPLAENSPTGLTQILQKNLSWLIPACLVVLIGIIISALYDIWHGTSKPPKK